MDRKLSGRISLQLVPADQSPFPKESADAACHDLVEIMASVVGDNPDHPQSSQEDWDKFMKGRT